MAFGFFGHPHDGGHDNDPRQRLARLTGQDHRTSQHDDQAGPHGPEDQAGHGADLAEFVDLTESPPAGGQSPAGDQPPAPGPAPPGRKLRRWLPAGASRVRLDPGRRTAILLAVVVLLGGLVATVGVWRSRPVAEPLPAALPAVGAPAAASTPAEAEAVVVSIAGLVTEPGLIRLPAGSRVADAVRAAGGVLPDTDLTRINLARRLTDGEHVVIDPDAEPVPAAGAAAPGVPGQGSGAMVNLNLATLDELVTLPGIGPVTAQHILDWRAEHGQFGSVDQLREVSGIGEVRFGRLRDLVTV